MSYLLEAMGYCLLLRGVEEEMTVVYINVKDNTKLGEVLPTTDDFIKTKTSKSK